MARESTEGENHQQNGIERSSVRHRTLTSKANHDQCCQEDGDPAKGDLNKRQIFRLQAQTEQGLKKAPECIHRQDCIAAENLVARMMTRSAA
jgi:hypothetical protein